MIKISDVLNTKNGILELDSGLNEQEFARSRLALYMNEEGLLCKPDRNGSFKTETFRFTGTKVQNGRVILSAPGFKGQSLLSFIQSAMTVSAEASPPFERVCTEKITALKALDTAYRAFLEYEKYRAVQTNSENTGSQKDMWPLHNCGPLNVLYGEDGSVLFLPSSLFERSMLSRSGKERAALYGFWVRGGTSESESFDFTFAASTYAVLTGQPPFPASKDEERIEDYTDDNFIPLSLLFPYIADNDEGRAFNALIRAVDTALCSPQVRRTSIQIKRQGKTFLPSLIVTEAAFAQNPFMPLNLMQDSSSSIKSEVCPAEYKTLYTFIKTRKKKVQRRRFMRKQGTKPAIAASVFVLMFAAAFSIVKTNMERPTTKGMTPIEAVHTFYTALHELDTLTLDGCGDRRALKAYSNTAASLFVTGKMRQAYEKTPDFLPPEQWPFAYNPLGTWIFGLTRLSVSGLEDTALNNAVTAQKGDSTRIKADFFMLANEGPEQYAISRHSDELTLSFNKRWRITDIQSTREDIQVDDEAFRRDIAEVLEAAQKDLPITAVPASQDSAAADKTDGNDTLAENLIREIGSLYGRYPWLPDEAALRHGAEKIPEYCRFR